MTPEVLGLAESGRNRAELDVEILDALRNGGPQTVSQLYDRLNGNKTRKQIFESLSGLVSLRMVHPESTQMSKQMSEQIEVPYFMAPLPQPPAIYSQAPTLTRAT